MHTTPSKIASACICATREILNLRPRWPHQLIQMTKYVYNDIEKYVIFLLNLKKPKDADDSTRSQYKRKITDSGYLSDLAGSTFDESYESASTSTHHCDISKRRKNSNRF